MVARKGILVEVLVPAARVAVILHAGPLRVLLEVRHILGSVASLKHRVGCRALLRALPEEVSAKRLGQLGGKHVPSRSARRQRCLVMHGSGNGNRLRR